MNIKIDIHKRDYSARRKLIDGWNIPNEEKVKFREFLDESQLGRVNKGKKISENRLCKYISMIKVPFEYWNKECDKLTMNDIEKFEKGLATDTIKKINGKPFADTSKTDVRKIIKIYMRWRIGENKALELVGWLDTRDVKQTPDFLTEEEVELLYRSCRTAEQRYLVSILFDTGARAEEFLNIRYEDIFMPKESTNFIKIALKEEYSKTKGRTISLYWKYSIEAVRDYLRERREDGINSNEQVFKGGYDQARNFLRRLALKVLNKPVRFHLFRHSSATYYASKMNRQQLCIRYGWAFSSDMPDTYIARAGMEDKELDERMSGTEIQKTKDEMIRKEQEWKIKQEENEERIKELEKEGEDNKRFIDDRMKELEERMTKGILALQKKKEIEVLSTTK